MFRVGNDIESMDFEGMMEQVDAQLVGDGGNDKLQNKENDEGEAKDVKAVSVMVGETVKLKRGELSDSIVK